MRTLVTRIEDGVQALSRELIIDLVNRGLRNGTVSKTVISGPRSTIDENLNRGVYSFLYGGKRFKFYAKFDTTSDLEWFEGSTLYVALDKLFFTEEEARAYIDNAEASVQSGCPYNIGLDDAIVVALTLGEYRR